MSRVYRFEENVGRTLDFDPERDLLVIVASSPDKIVVTSFGSDLNLATPDGMVTLKSTGLHQLNQNNIAFTPAEAVAAKTADKNSLKNPVAVVTPPEPKKSSPADDLFAFADAKKPANSEGPQTTDMFTGKAEEPPVPHVEPVVPYLTEDIVAIANMEAANCGNIVIEKQPVGRLVDYVVSPYATEDTGLELVLPVSQPASMEFISSLRA